MYLGAIFIAILIFAIIIIIFGIAQYYSSKPSPPTPECSATNPCQNGDVCQNGFCLSPIGGTCSTLSDCVSQATICQNNVCLGQTGNGIGQPCPCQAGLFCVNGFCQGPLGSTCSANSDCMSGYCLNGLCSSGPTGMTGATGMTGTTGITCDETSYPSYSSSVSSNSSYSSSSSSQTSSPVYTSCQVVYRGYGNGKMLPVVNKKYLSNDNAIDVTSHDGYIYILLDGGDLLRVTDQIPTRLSSDYKITRLLAFNDSLYGLANGYLYKASDEGDQIKWEKVKGFTGLIDGCVTYDGLHIWLESITQGYLYGNDWKLVDHVKRRKSNQRVYGQTRKDYLDYYDDEVVSSTGDVYPPGHAAYHPNGYVFHPRNDDIIKIRTLKYKGQYSLYFILKQRHSSE